MSTDLKGFRVLVRDGKHNISISNTVRQGYITFKDSEASFGIDLEEKDFIALVKHLSMQAEKIEKRVNKEKSEKGFVIDDPKLVKRRKISSKAKSKSKEN